MATPILDLRHLTVVEAIHRTGSVTKAALALHLTQPAVSHALAQAERRLGVKIFHRRPRGLDPTAAGDRLVRTARSVLDQLRETEAELQDLEDAGTLRLTTECYTCYHWLPSLLAELAQVLPRLRVEIVPESTRRPLQALLAREVDLAIVHSEVAHAELEALPLFADEVVAAFAPEHRFALRASLEAEDFADEEVLLHFDPEQSVLFTELLAPAGVAPRRVSEVRLTEAMVELARSGLGVAVLARWAIAPQLEAGTLRAARLGERGIFRKWSAARRRDDRESKASEELMRLLRDRGERLVREKGQDA